MLHNHLKHVIIRAFSMTIRAKFPPIEKDSPKNTIMPSKCVVKLAKRVLLKNRQNSSKYLQTDCKIPDYLNLAFKIQQIIYTSNCIR